MTADTAQLNVCLPATLKEQVERTAATAGRSLSAEVTQRLEQSFTPQCSRVAQHELALPLPASAQADQVTAARDIFVSVLTVAERMRVDRHTAIARALQSALKRTGVDLAHELAAHPGENEQSPDHECGPAKQFITAWRDGSLALPWAPALLLDAHSAFTQWCLRFNQECIPANHFSRVLGRSNALRHERKRWRVFGVVAGPASFLIPTHSTTRRRQGFDVDWYGACVKTFRDAANAAGLAT
ncbi:Arc family DNA-binding protein [Xanthomonas campestris]|uniref:Arc family DNA-binding protein n=1 Tax=Xanthomonas campestris TaxID=339 RepID=UPI0013795507